MNNEEIATRLTAIETVLGRMEHRLFGNGQPGELSLIHSRLDEVEETHATAKGAFAVLSFLITLIGGGEILHWFKMGTSK
jgi:hypothetical protein